MSEAESKSAADEGKDEERRDLLEDLRESLPAHVRDDFDDAMGRGRELSAKIPIAEAAVLATEGDEREGRWRNLERLRAERKALRLRTSFTLKITPEGPRLVPARPEDTWSPFDARPDESSWPLVDQRAVKKTEWLLRLRGTLSNRLALKWAPGSSREQNAATLARLCAMMVNKALRSAPAGIARAAPELTGRELGHYLLTAPRPDAEIVMRKLLRAAGFSDVEVKRLMKLLETRETRSATTRKT